MFCELNIYFRYATIIFANFFQCVETIINSVINVIFLFNSSALIGVYKTRCMWLKMVDHEEKNEETIMGEFLGKFFMHFCPGTTYFSMNVH